MKQHNLDPRYGDDGVARTGLLLSMGEVPAPVVLAPDDIDWGDVAPHYGTHQMDLHRTDLANCSTPPRAAA